MAIQVSCPGCNAVLKTTDSYAGKRAKCPKCGAVIQIPELPASESEDEILDPELIGAAAGFSDDEYELEAPSPPPPKTDDRKPCPMCGEMIASTAVKCRHCGEIFDPELRKQAKKAKGNSEDEDLTAGEWVFAVLCSGIACIFGIVWMIQGKPKGTKMLLIALAMQAFWVVVQVAVNAVNQP